MSLTGSQVAFGTTTTQETTYLEGGPTIYFEDYNGSERYAPDADGYYWNLSGSSSYPVYAVGCYQNFHLMDNVTMNDLRCDATGVVATIQHRNYIDMKFDLESFLPFSVLARMLKGGGTPILNAVEHSEKFGFGKINNNQFWHVYLPLVYNPDLGHYVSVTIHKAQFVDGWDWNWQYGQSHMVNITLRGFFDTTKPAAQGFATLVRSDTSVL